MKANGDEKEKKQLEKEDTKLQFKGKKSGSTKVNDDEMDRFQQNGTVVVKLRWKSTGTEMVKKSERQNQNPVKSMNRSQ